jgi:nucleoside-diphosphate-sugar epimerase
LVVASSVGAYAPGPKSSDRPAWSGVDESWLATGVRTSAYSRDKAAVEAMLDSFTRTHPAVRVVRLRTSLVFQRAAASQIHRLFLGPFAPWRLPRFVRLVPAPAQLIFQATHAADIGDAYARAALDGAARGAYNVAADPVLTPQLIAASTGGRVVALPARLLRWLAEGSFRLRLQPSGGGWIDMATQTPLMDSTRARTELGWAPTHTSIDALHALLDGIGDGAGTATAPLQPRGTTPRRGGSKPHARRRRDPPDGRSPS